MKYNEKLDIMEPCKANMLLVKERERGGDDDDQVFLRYNSITVLLKAAALE